MKKLLCSLIALLSITAFAQDTKVIVDANAVSRSISGSFNAIDVSSGIELYLSQGKETSLAVSASDTRHFDRLKTEIVNGTLKIYYDNKGITWKSSGRANLKAYVSFALLEKLNASAGAAVLVNGSIRADQFDLVLSSGSVFTGAVDTKNLAAEVNSGAVINISGNTDKLHVDVSSGAIFKGLGLVTDYCDASAKSGALVNVTVNKELNAKVKSGADIQYKGTALIRDIKTSSGGRIKKV